MKWFDRVLNQSMYPECDTVKKLNLHLVYWHKLLGMSLNSVINTTECVRPCQYYRYYSSKVILNRKFFMELKYLSRSPVTLMMENTVLSASLLDFPAVF